MKDAVINNNLFGKQKFVWVYLPYCASKYVQDLPVLGLDV